MWSLVSKLNVGSKVVILLESKSHYLYPWRFPEVFFDSLSRSRNFGRFEKCWPTYLFSVLQKANLTKPKRSFLLIYKSIKSFMFLVKSCENLKIGESDGISKMVSKLNVGSKVVEICAFEVWKNQKMVKLLFFKCAKTGKIFRRNRKVIIYTHEDFQKFFLIVWVGQGILGDLRNVDPPTYFQC